MKLILIIELCILILLVGCAEAEPTKNITANNLTGYLDWINPVIECGTCEVIQSIGDNYTCVKDQQCLNGGYMIDSDLTVQKVP